MSGHIENCGDRDRHSLCRWRYPTQPSETLSHRQAQLSHTVVPRRPLPDNTSTLPLYCSVEGAVMAQACFRTCRNTIFGRFSISRKDHLAKTRATPRGPVFKVKDLSPAPSGPNFPNLFSALCLQLTSPSCYIPKLHKPLQSLVLWLG
jgi:hypothetical protein